MKKVSVIGSTGSVGQKALNIAKKLGMEVEAIVGHSNLDKLIEQNEQFKPQYVGVIDESLYLKAREIFGSKLVCGQEALTFACGLSSQIIVISVTGLNGIYPLIDALREGKRVALSNKESLVAGGELLTKMFGKGLSSPYNVINRLIPLDSEHSAVFQCLKAGKKGEVKKIILTASGGAFYEKDFDSLKGIKPNEIYHPNWKMGRKITIDSSTMMNKALEIIEAAWLFDCTSIDYVVHKESVIHSMVQFNDGSIVAQLCKPDMGLPIQFAYTYPKRVESDFSNYELTGNLTILKKNSAFYAPELAFDVLKAGGTAGAVMNAANEAAVKLFEQGKIGFMDIVDTVKKALDGAQIRKINALDDIIYAHNETFNQVLSFKK